MDEITKRNIQAYDDTVDAYHNTVKNLEDSQIRKREYFLSLIPKDGRILDLGCGSGKDSKFFSERGLDVIGVDLSSKMLKKAKTVAPKAKFMMMDMRDLDFEPNSFDAVWFGASLFCIEKKYALNVLGRVNVIMKDRSILHLNMKEGTGEGFELDPRYNVEKYFAYYEEGEVKELLN